ncbi:MAG: alpha-amylase family glycosyl hydrolase [Candidatus Promineifilaceae bacterium]|jgi:glycosidase
MAAKIEENAPLELSEVDLTPRGSVHPSPIDWRDQILYQLLPDRFSDGHETERDIFDRRDPKKHIARDRAHWMAAGKRFAGGNIEGIRSKLDYLQDLGVTTIWINPVWRQRCDLETYHGYGIQNFLDIDPRFGSRQQLRDLVDAAHQRGMYVILDVIFNHSGNNWFYRDERSGQARETMPYRSTPPYPIHGWRSARGESLPVPISIDDGVWPREFQNAGWYTRCGQIGHWSADYWEDPQSSDLEFRKGDFYDLKDFNLENEETICSLAKVYQYWIALSDCDGFRIDAVKHVSVEESRKFCSALHEYAESIGKENFLLTGEITDTGLAPGYVDFLGRNLDAVLGIMNYPLKLSGMVKGIVHPNDFFRLFEQNQLKLSYRQLGRFVVTVVDDHDMSSRPTKERFAAGGDAENLYHQVAHVVGVQLTTPGIPSIYYGTEQAFNGSERDHDYSVERRRFAEDRYVRETMFGGEFGAFCTRGCHFFDERHPTYLRIAAITRVRNRQDLIGKTLRRGHLYLRETSFFNYPFAIYGPGELVAWSQILFDNEVLMVLNTHSQEVRGAEITVDSSLHPDKSLMTFLYRSDWSEAQLVDPPVDQSVPVRQIGGRAVVRLELPPSGMVILA